MSSPTATARDLPAGRVGWPTGRDSGPQVVALGLALALTAMAIDLLLAGSLTLFFDLAFVATCLALAWQVRAADFFTVGVLPPLLMLAVFTLAGLVAPGLIAHPSDGVVQAVISGLSVHAGALIAGYVLALASLAYRVHLSARLTVQDLL